MSKKLMYFDMEWVPIYPTLSELMSNDELLYDAFINRVKKLRNDKKYGDDFTDEMIWEKESSFTAEFCKIICITFGYWNGEEKVFKTLYDHDEKQLLGDAQKILINASNGGYELCGYAIKRWDMPWLAKRMAINRLKLPNLINNGTKKPWEIRAVDLPEVWSMGCPNEKYTPFEVLCVTMGIPTPKDDIGGADVKRVYWEEDDLERIATYCEKDVDRTMDLEKVMREFITY